MMKEAKQPNHVLSNKIKCPNYIKCPLCYGCRGYSTHDVSCKQCEVDRKRDICNKDLHRDDLIVQLITKDKIELKDIKFESFDKKQNKEDIISD